MIDFPVIYRVVVLFRRRCAGVEAFDEVADDNRSRGVGGEQGFRHARDNAVARGDRRDGDRCDENSECDQPGASYEAAPRRRFLIESSPGVFDGGTGRPEVVSVVGATSHIRKEFEVLRISLG